MSVLEGDDVPMQFSEETKAGMASAKRRALVQNAWLLIEHKAQVHYIQQRPMRNERDHMVNVLKRFRRHVGISMDCSEAVSFLYFTSGCHDPNGMDFDGWGNSGTMFSHLNHHYTDPNRALPGALVVYGPGGDEHVAMVMQHDFAHNPWLFSHGQEAGPFHIRLHDEDAGHPGQPRTFLDVSSLL